MENLRTYNIHALLVIGGFEVRLSHPGSLAVVPTNVTSNMVLGLEQPKGQSYEYRG